MIYVALIVGVSVGIAIGLLIARATPQAVKVFVTLERITNDDDSADAWKKGGQ